MRPDHRRVEHLHQMRGLAQTRQYREIVLEHTRLAEPVEPFPDAVFQFPNRSGNARQVML